MSMRGFDDVAIDVVGDLRDYQPVVSLLPERQAIYISHPEEDKGYGVSLTITPIPAGTTAMRDIQRRDVRLQATVKSTDQWRANQPESEGGGHLAMMRILSAVGDRLDKAKGIEETAQGGVGTTEPIQMKDGRLAVLGDWRVAGWYDDPSPRLEAQRNDSA